MHVCIWGHTYYLWHAIYKNWSDRLKTHSGGFRPKIDIPFFISFVLYTITTIKIKTAKNLAKPVYNWQNIIIIGASITILLLSLELLL